LVLDYHRVIFADFTNYVCKVAKGPDLKKQNDKEKTDKTKLPAKPLPEQQRLNT
jgi:hypothetical protein